MQTTIPFGTAPNGTPVQLFLLSNQTGAVVGVTDLGANLVSCHVPDGRGNFPDVTLGHAGAAGYVGDGYNLGAVVGRNANRIAGARFEVAGSSYRLAANNGPNNLHSGPHKWSERLWKVADADENSVTFELTSRKGDQGFPGSVQVHVTYALTDDNQLRSYYRAMPSEADPHQPDLPRLLEPQRPRRGKRARPHAADPCRLLHPAGGPHPHRRDRASGGHALRLP